MAKRKSSDMAALRPVTRRSLLSADGENHPALAAKQAGKQAGAKRRALGDIGNVQAAAGSRAGADKDAAAKPDAKQTAAADGSRRVTRAQSKAMAQGGNAQTEARSTAAGGSRRSGSLGGATSRRQSQAPQAHQQQPAPQQEQQQQDKAEAATAAAAPQEQVQQPQATAPPPKQQRQQQQQPAAAPPSPLPDIDAPDRHNHLAECRYVNDIYGYFRRIEPKFRAPANYMEQQPDINEKMRAILIDWLVEVHLKFKLMPESLFLTINLIDRYLAKRQVTRKNLQLVGVTAMLVAAKYEEIWAPEVRDFVYISDKAYTRKQILDTEKDMLAALDYNLSLPTSYQFLARLLKAASVHYHKELALFVAYSAELCLVEYGMLRYSYSELAAGIMYVAMRAFNKPDPFPHALARHAATRREAVLHISKEVVRLVQGAKERANLQAVVKKYSTPKFCHAADVPLPLDILRE